MYDVMVCLVGEQPVPNLLPIRHLKPSIVVFAYSDRTDQVYNNLRQFLNQRHPEIQVLSLEVRPYDILDAYTNLKQFLAQFNQSPRQLIINVTGGTKPMSYAGFLVARELKATVVYLQSEGGRSLLHMYAFDEDGGLVRADEPQEITEVVTIDEYLHLHGLEVSKQMRYADSFEQVVAEALKPHVGEIVGPVRVRPFSFTEKSPLEIDLIIRWGNTVGVVEVKRGDEEKKGIDQLSTAAPSDRLGTYVKRFYIRNKGMSLENMELAKARDIKVVVLESFSENSPTLSPEDAELLKTEVLKGMGVKVD
ncbi:MAG: DUF1887 family CARF protein [Armatimonadota bacterium]|nr:DUF1887 family CARF protein [Armatimonadota bacterium]